MHVHLRLNSSSGVHLIMKMLSDRSEKIKKLEGSSNFIHLHRFFTFYRSKVARTPLACIANGYKSSRVDRGKRRFFIFIYTYRISHRNQINSRKRFCLLSRNSVETYRVSNVLKSQSFHSYLVSLSVKHLDVNIRTKGNFPVTIIIPSDL